MKHLLSLRFIFRAFSVLSWTISVIRFCHQLDWVSWIAFAVGTVSFIGSFFASNKPIFEISEAEKSARDRRNRTAMLKLVNDIWVEGILKKSLHNAVLIELGLEERKDVVDTPDRPWGMILRTGDEPNQVLPPGTKILDVFDDVRQALLILGEPGSGKTTMLLELARQTISRAGKDPVQPIPVVFNLSSWIKPAQSLAGWLVDELRFKYYIPEKIAKAWVENYQLLLLLDGLDEVAAERRDACVKAINEFRQEHLTPIVICSRTTEYESLTTSLKVHSAVCIQPLSEEQVRNYLDKVGSGLSAVREMLKDDEPLQELSRSPLMLNIMTLAYEGASVEELQQLDTTEARRKHLFNKYIDVMFNRVARTKNELYPREKTTKWLSWLAEKMSQEAQSMFLIERIQPTWMRLISQQRQYIINVVIVWVLTFGLIGGLIIGPIARITLWPIKGMSLGLTEGMAWGLIGGLIGGLTLGLIEGCKKIIKPVESLRWSWENAKYGLIAWPIAGPILGLISGMIVGLVYGLIDGLTLGLFVMLAFAPIELITLSGLSYREVNERTIPNQGIHQSAKNAALVFLATSIVSVLVFGVFVGLIVVFGLNVRLDIKVLERCGSIILILLFVLCCCLSLIDYGGIAFIQHFVLRFALYRNGYIPWNIVRFLDYAAERIFLQKVGGGYKFIHRLIQEHFASLR